MNSVSWLIAILGGTAFVGILLYSMYKNIGRMLLDRTVEFHMRNIDGELHDLLRRDKEV